MITKKLLTGVLLLVGVIGYAQEKTAADAYLDYFKSPRESLYMHTNKTTYLPGEEIWFKVYALDRQSQLTSKKTSNIHFGLFDKDGKQLDRKLFLAKEGYAYGNIAIDSTFASGDYYLKISTNWMKNFKEDDTFVKQIKVINPASDEVVQQVSKKEYDIQFLPEGGHILADVKNSIGIKAIDDTGKGSEASGIIVDKNDSEVASFSSNMLGLGRFSFIPQSGQTYTAKITLSNAKEIKVPLPEIKEKGICIQVNNLRSDNVIVNLTTNSQSFNEVSQNSYELLIHKDGATKVIPVEFTTAQRKIAIPKKDLFKGINTVTLFDQNQTPILERMFFNDALVKKHTLVMEKANINFDSIVYALKADSDLPIEINASISVLPRGTQSYNPKHNISSAFYLQPHLKGAIENPSYYFTNINRKKRYELDVLLMTQGWSRYSWDDIFYKTPEIVHPFQSGLTISGAINNNLNKVTGLIMYPSIHHNSINLSYDDDGKFTIENLHLVRGEYLSFSAFGSNGKAKKPGLVMNFPQAEELTEQIDVQDYQTFVSYYSNKTTSFEGFVTQKRDLLNEIVLTANVDKKKRKESLLKTTGKIYNIDRATDKRYINVSQFLDNKGFAVVNPTGLIMAADFDIFSSGTTRSVSIAPDNSNPDPDDGTPPPPEPPKPKVGIGIKHLNPNKNPVVIFLDNVQLNDYAIVATRPLHEFEDIYVDDSYNTNLVSVAGDVATFATVIKLFTRRTPLEFNPTVESKLQKAVKVPFGFEPRKEFYAPKYGSFKSDLFQEVGAIDWKPNVKISGNTISNLSILDTGLNEVTFYIEGITSNGDFISQKISIDSQGD
jgi:hypothetical protein